MKVLFLNPPYTRIVGIKSSAGKVAPLNLLYLISYLRKYSDIETFFLDCEAEEYNFENVEEFFSKERFDALAMTCPTPVFNIVVKIAKIAKKINPSVKVIIGGPHPTALPDTALKEEAVDFIVMKEGEETLLELCQSLKNGDNDFKKINGIGFRESNGTVFLTPPRKPIEDLDTIPFPARDVLKLEKYYSAPTKALTGKKSTSILGSRGCYFNCIHCISRLMYGQKIRVRGAHKIVDEIEECYRKYGIEEFKFDDDNITQFRDVVLEMCRLIHEKKLNIAWICMSRVDCITEDLAREMKKAGCKKVSFGLESGSKKVLGLMRKGVDPEKAKEAVRILHKSNIDSHASFMLGNLDETEETIKETINFAKYLNLDYATFFITSPFPGTDLYELAKRKGYIHENTKWEEFAPLTDQNPIVMQDNLSSEELIKWQKTAFRQFYFRPTQIFKKISKIRSIKQFKLLMEGFSIFQSIHKRKIRD